MFLLCSTLTTCPLSAFYIMFRISKNIVNVHVICIISIYNTLHKNRTIYTRFGEQFQSTMKWILSVQCKKELRCFIGHPFLWCSCNKHCHKFSLKFELWSFKGLWNAITLLILKDLLLPKDMLKAVHASLNNFFLKCKKR